MEFAWLSSNVTLNNFRLVEVKYIAEPFVALLFVILAFVILLSLPLKYNAPPKSARLLVIIESFNIIVGITYNAPPFVALL